MRVSAMSYLCRLFITSYLLTASSLCLAERGGFGGGAGGGFHGNGGGAPNTDYHSQNNYHSHQGYNSNYHNNNNYNHNHNYYDEGGIGGYYPSYGYDGTVILNSEVDDPAAQCTSQQCDSNGTCVIQAGDCDSN